MSKKVIIIGGVAGGASAAARLRRMDEDVEITIYEKGEYISFANCGLPYYLGEVIEERSQLLVQTPASMEARFNINVCVNMEVININRNKNEIEIRDLNSGEVKKDKYDYLILSPGAEAIKPPLQGIDLGNVFTLRNMEDTDKIKTFLDQEKPARAVVVGGGYIGLEMADNLAERGIQVSVIEMLDQVLNPLDYEMATMIHYHLRNKGIELYLSNGLKAIEKNECHHKVILENGAEIDTDLVILSIGVKPSVELAQKAGLKIGSTGGIKVNDYLQTTDQNIFAIGDAIEVTDLVNGNPSLIPLAGPANKQGRIAANNICGKKDKYKASQGTAIARVFDMTVATTGINEKQLKENNIDYKISYTNSNNHAGYYPGANSMWIKLIFTPEQGKILGAQIVGYDGVDKRIDVLATAINQSMTVYDLQELELAYAPPYGSAKDPVNMAAYVAGNILDSLVEVIHWDQIDNLDENTVILDVREKIEAKFGKIEGSLIIPLNQLRNNLDKLNKNKEIVIYCAVGLRGYIAYRILKANGFENVKNLAGGYSLYSYVKNDQKEGINSEEELAISSISNPEEAKEFD
ncbi:MAG: CoA-disulfide reductase [Halanaerobiales bacterium]